MNISNSLIKAYLDYKKETLCGKLFSAKYIEKIIPYEESKDQQAGKWFEFQATGALPLNGKEPQEVRTSKGSAAITKHLEGQLANFRTIYADINIQETNFKVETTIDNQRYLAYLDVICENMIRDIKTTGHINNFKDHYGWIQLTGDDNAYWIPEKSHLYQAKFYIWIVFKTTGIVMPFFFDVFSNKNSDDCKTIQVNMDEDSINYFEEWLFETVSELKADIEKGFQCYANYKNCTVCPLFMHCDEKSTKPEIEQYFV